MPELTQRQQYERLRSRLELERSTFRTHWRDLSDFILPRRPRFFVTDVNKGDRRSQSIKDTTATLAIRTLQSGMMSGLTSPARPWFRLTVPDQQLAESESVQLWLHEVTRRMTTLFLRTNLYNVLPTLYGDLATFGTGCLFVEEDMRDGLRFFVMPIGSYAVANNHRLVVETFTREFRLTVDQIVDQFARDPGTNEINWRNISQNTRELFERGETQQWIDLCHVILKNPQYDPEAIEPQFKKFLSVYYEKSGFGETDDKFLRKSGFDFFPVLCPRWEVTGEDVYGTNCPGMVALGDIKQLQLGERRTMQAVEKLVNPPLVAPSHLRSAKVSLVPGDITYADVREGQQGLRPLHEVSPRIQEMEAKQEQVRRRISRGFYEDLFLMLSLSDRREITAREVEERHEEKLLALGPVLEQLNQDLLDPLIDITFDTMANQGRLPPPPPELAGLELKVEYISIMAQAQKLLGLGSLERFTQFTTLVAQGIGPTVLDKVDGDQLIDVYGDLTSLPPGIVKPDEQVAEERAQRQQALQQQQQLESMQQVAATAKDLSKAETDGGNVLSDILGGGQEVAVA